MSIYTAPAAIDQLAALIGTWRMDAVFSDGRQGPPGDTGARTVFEHGPGAQFLIQRWQVPHPAAPDGIAIITVDQPRDGYLQHYFDDRGVVRLYQMTFAAGLWTLERTAGTSHRLTSLSAGRANSPPTARRYAVGGFIAAPAANGARTSR